MAKPIISWAVVRSVFPRPQSDVEIIGVTSEAGRHIYGRDRDGAPTNRALRDVFHRYATEGEADAARNRIAAARAHWSPVIADAEQKARGLRERMQAAIRAAALPPTGEPLA